MIMLNFTPEVDILLRGDEPTWSAETQAMVEAHPIDVIDTEISGIENGDDGWLEAIEFEDGTRREYRGGFAMYGSEFNTELAEQLGCELNDSGEIEVDDHGSTSVEGVWAVGDVTPGHNQVPVAMGQGAKAGIDVHYDLRKFPMSVEEIESRGGISKNDVPAISRRLRDRAAAHEGGPGDEEQAAADD
jgi:thioredoxin reductase (NADPH)